LDRKKSFEENKNEIFREKKMIATNVSDTSKKLKHLLQEIHDTENGIIVTYIY
jgi:hypothetical protein